MPNPPAHSRTRQWLVRVVSFVSALIGLKYGFDFGARISGLWMGFAMAAITAIFASMMAVGILERLFLRRPSGRDGA